MTAPVTYIPGFLPNHAEVFERLWAELNWERRAAPGKEPRRLEYWTNVFNRDYTYGEGGKGGARSYEAQPSHEMIDAVTAALAPVVGFEYEACFLNGYPAATSGLEWHADDDPKIDHSRPIAVVTVGFGRVIQFKPIGNAKLEGMEEVMLEPGSLLLMPPGMQDTHLHRIPKMKDTVLHDADRHPNPKVGYVTKPRVSLTYRGLFA